MTGFAILAFPVGLLTWSLAEYLVHRFVLHDQRLPFFKSHMLHHRDPGAEVGAPYTVSVPLTVLYVVTLAGLFNWSGWFFGVGGVVGYAVYLVIHEGTHAGARIPLLTALHDRHHAGGPYNYGITSPLWDLMFGTYRRAR